MIALHQRPSVQRDLIRCETAALLQTPLLRKRPIRTKAQLYAFMETHVFAVWDFMCLTKALQHAIAPSNPIWFPPANCRSASLINEIIVSEESDVSLDGASYKSHFEIYIDAMDEVGANTASVRAFLELVRREGVDLALARATMPEAARRFVTTTMSFVHSGKPWVIGAAFTYGREDVIPICSEASLKTALWTTRPARCFDITFSDILMWTEALRRRTATARWLRKCSIISAVARPIKRLRRPRRLCGRWSRAVSYGRRFLIP
jgi:hypothetical protein